MSEKRYRFEEDENGWVQFKVTIGEGLSARDFGFTFQRIPEDEREWLAEVVSRQLDAAYQMGLKVGKSFVAEPLIETLKKAGIKVERV